MNLFVPGSYNVGNVVQRLLRLNFPGLFELSALVGTCDGLSLALLVHLSLYCRHHLLVHLLFQLIDLRLPLNSL